MDIYQCNLQAMGTSGCYYLCLAKAAGVTSLDRIYHVALLAQERGYLGEDYFVTEPVEILHLLNPDMDVTSVVHAAANERSKKSPWTIERHEGNPGHFVAVRGDEVYDPWSPNGSYAGKNGPVKSTRCIN